MNNRIKYFAGTLLIMAIIAIGFGCKKDNTSTVNITNPSLSSFTFSPATGLPTTQVTITGSKFGTYKNALTVLFGGIVATQIDSLSDNIIIARVPVGAASGPVSIKVWDASLTSSTTFTVLPPPVIISLSTGAGLPGDTIAINGTGFGADVSKLVLSFNGTSGTVLTVGNNGTLITAVVPSGFTSGTLSLTVNGYAVTGPAFGALTPVPTPVYQLDFENNLNATIGNTAATYNQGTAAALTYISGVKGQAAYLPGYTSTGWGDNNQAISLPPNVAQYNELTISAWVLFDGSGPNANWGTPAWSIGHTRGNNITLDLSTGWPAMNYNLTQGIVFENVIGFTGYNSYSANSSATVKGSTWHHVCVTYSKTALASNLYVDGVIVSNGKVTLPSAYDLTVYTQDRNYLGVGCVSNTGEPGMKGGIDQFKVWNSTLTANQVYTVFYKK